MVAPWQVGCLTMLCMYQDLGHHACTYSLLAIRRLLIVGYCREQPIAVEAVGGPTILAAGSVCTVPPRDCSCPFPRVLFGISTAACLHFASTWRQVCGACCPRMDFGTWMGVVRVTVLQVVQRQPCLYGNLKWCLIQGLRDCPLPDEQCHNWMLYMRRCRVDVAQLCNHDFLRLAFMPKHPPNSTSVISCYVPFTASVCTMQRRQVSVALSP